MNLLILQIIRKLYEFEPGAQTPLFKLTHQLYLLTLQQKGYLCTALGMYYYYGIRGDQQIKYQKPDLLRAKIFFSIASIQYGNPIASRMLNIMRINFQFSIQKNLSIQQYFLYLNRIEIKRQVSALSGDIDSKISLAKKVAAVNETRQCTKQLQILKNISKQIIQQQYYERTFYSKTFQLLEYHYFNKKYQHKISSPQQNQIILKSQTYSSKHRKDLQNLMLKYYLGIQNITPNKTKTYQIAQKLVQLYGQQSKISHRILGNRYFKGHDVLQDTKKAMYHFNISYQYYKDVKCQMGLIIYMGLGNYGKSDKKTGLNMMMNSSNCGIYLWALYFNKNKYINITAQLIQQFLKESLALSDYAILQLSLQGKLLTFGCNYLRQKYLNLIDKTQIIGNKYRSLQRAFSKGQLGQSFLKNLDLMYIYQSDSYPNLLYFLEVEKYFPDTSYNLKDLNQSDWIMFNKFIKIDIDQAKNRYFRNNKQKKLYDYSFDINMTQYKKYHVVQCIFLKNSYCYFVQFKWNKTQNQQKMLKVASQSSDRNYILQARYLLYLFYKNKGNQRRAKRFLYSALQNFEPRQYIIRLINLLQNPLLIIYLNLFNKLLFLFFIFVLLAIIAHRKRLQNLSMLQNHWCDEDQNNQQQSQQ